MVPINRAVKPFQLEAHYWWLKTLCQKRACYSAFYSMSGGRQSKKEQDGEGKWRPWTGGIPLGVRLLLAVWQSVLEQDAGPPNLLPTGRKQECCMEVCTAGQLCSDFGELSDLETQCMHVPFTTREWGSVGGAQTQSGWVCTGAWQRKGDIRVEVKSSKGWNEEESEPRWWR